MPRYEKTVDKKEYFIEVVLDGPYVRFVKGTRKIGDKKWLTKKTDKQTFIFQNQEKAKKYYRDQISKLKVGSKLRK